MKINRYWRGTDNFKKFTVKYFWQKYKKNLPPANEYNQASECQSHYKKTKCQIEI